MRGFWVAMLVSHVHNIQDMKQSCWHFDKEGSGETDPVLCTANCKQAQKRFERWLANNKRGAQPDPVQCEGIEPAKGRKVKCQMNATQTPYNVQARSHMLVKHQSLGGAYYALVIR